MDILLLALLAVGFVLGLISGAVKQIVSLAALVLGFAVASLYSQELSNVLADALPMPDVCRIVAFVLLWVIVILVARLAGALLTSLLDKVLAIGMLNRLLGGTSTTPEEELSRIMAVTPADVARAAQRFQPDTVFFLNGTAEEDGEEDYDE